MAIKSQKPNLEGFAVFYLIVFQLFALHQAKLDLKKKSKACFHEINTCFSSSSTSADLKGTRIGCSVRGRM